MHKPQRAFDRLLLNLLGSVPAKFARHLLFLLKSYPELADGWGYHVRSIHYYEPLPDFRELSEVSVSRRREPGHGGLKLLSGQSSTNFGVRRVHKP